jgi:4-amino-4-deoxy-L-arabinose transferase-like glycosyltransferase
MNSYVGTEGRASVATRAEPSAGASVRSRLLLMVLIGLAVRLACVPFLYQWHLDPWRGHWRFAWEMGMVAKSLFNGHGFSSPFLFDSGPTACMPPLYPALLAGLFKLFGPFSPASVLAALAINGVFSALTCVPLFFIARRTFGAKVAAWAGWLWTFFPYAIYLSADRIWDTAITTFLFTCLFWLTLYLAESGGVAAWAGYGLLWGVGALLNPSILVMLPFLGLWACYRRLRQGMAWFRPAVVSALIFAACITPWEVRNYRVFHRFIPIRDNFWMQVRSGNTGDTSDIAPDWAHPRSPGQAADYQRLGELGYMALERKLSVDFVSRYPGMYAWLSVKRVIFTWTGFWSLNPAYTKNEPLQIPNVIFCSVWTLLMLAGLRLAWRRYPLVELTPYLATIAFYPAVYYLTCTFIEYRHTIDPLVVAFSAYAVVKWRERVRGSRFSVIGSRVAVATENRKP